MLRWGSTRDHHGSWDCEPHGQCHGQNQDELLPWRAGQAAATEGHPACGRPPAWGEGNADIVYSSSLRPCPRRPAEQMADQSLWPAGQGLASEGTLHLPPSTSLFASGSRNALVQHSCRAQHQLPAPLPCWEEAVTQDFPEQPYSVLQNSLFYLEPHGYFILWWALGELLYHQLQQGWAISYCWLRKQKSPVRDFPEDLGWSSSPLIALHCVALPSLVKASPLFFVCCQSITIACTHWQALRRRICNWDP